MCFKSKSHLKFNIPEFLLNNAAVPLVNNFKHLGHHLCENSSDSIDIERQRKKIFAQGNTLIRKFFMCTLDVKTKLFETFCSPLYTAHLWIKYTNTEINKLYSAYHSSLKLLVGLPKREYTSPVFANLSLRTCPAVVRNLVFRFMGRLRDSSNNLIRAIYNSSLFYQSAI